MNTTKATGRIRRRYRRRNYISNVSPANYSRAFLRRYHMLQHKDYLNGKE